MARNRYVSDYRIVESMDARGRVRSEAEYIGARYAWAEDEKSVRRAVRGVLAGCVVGWLGWLGALLPLSAATRTVYVCVPFVFAAVPLALATGVVAGALRGKLPGADLPLGADLPPFEHRFADRLENRGPACSFFMMLLSGFSLAGEAVAAFRGASLLWGDAVFCAGAAAVFACGLCMHRRWRRLRCREIQ